MEASQFARMNLVNYIQSYTKIVSIIAILAAVILFPPISAHAGMRHLEDSVFQVHQGADKSARVGHSLDMKKASHTDDFGVDRAKPHGGSNQCCSAMCVTTVLLDHSGSLPPQITEEHVSQVFLELKSVSVTGFLRPPNL